MATEETPETQTPTVEEQPPAEVPLLDIEEQSTLELPQGDTDQEPWTRYGIKKASRIDLKHSSIENQSSDLADRLAHEHVLIVIGRDCGAPIVEIASSAGFKRADRLGADDASVFVLNLNEELVDDEELQRPQALDDIEEAMRVLPSAAHAIDGAKHSILCIEISLDEPLGFARSILSESQPTERLRLLAQEGQQLIFVLELKAQEKIPTFAQGNKPGVIALDWVEPLLAYYNESWDLDANTIATAAQNLRSTYVDKPEREAALYGIIHGLKSNSFRGAGGREEFEEKIRDAIAESQKIGETIRQLGNYFSSGNRIEQTILALAAFGPTMSNRTFSALGELFLPEEKIPPAFLPEYALNSLQDLAAEARRPTWTQAWKEHLDFYRNKLKIGQSRNQEVELRVNRDSLREHLLENYPVGLQRIVEAIPKVLLQKGYERELEESAIRLLIRLAVTDPRSYDKAWFVKCLLSLSENPLNPDKQSFALSKVGTALRVLDEQTSDQRSGFADSVFDELVKTLRKRNFPIDGIVELCRRLDSTRFRTQAVLAQLLQNSSLDEFRSVLDNIGFTRTKITPSQRLRLMSSFTKNLLPAEQYRENGTADHRAKRALWIWNAGLRADRFPPHVPYQKIALQRTLAHELFVGDPESARSLLDGLLNFDPRALVFAGRSRRDLRRWLENIPAVVLRAADAEMYLIASSSTDALSREVSDCIMGPVFGSQSPPPTEGWSAFDELEPPELWRDIYVERDTDGGSDQFKMDVADRLLRLPLVARSSLIAEWFFQLKFGSHAFDHSKSEEYYVGGIGKLLDVLNDKEVARNIADDFDYLAGITANVVSLIEANDLERRLSDMYIEKRLFLERLKMDIAR